MNNAPSNEPIRYRSQFKIGTRLALCFITIILLMSVGSAVLLWQFWQARIQAGRLNGVDQELIAVLQAHTSLTSFYERLDALAHSEDTSLLLEQVETIREALAQETERTRGVLRHLPPEVRLDPTLLPTLFAIQGELPSQLQALTTLAKIGDWNAVRLRLVNQIRPLESRSMNLVSNVDREVDEQRAQAVLNIQMAEKRMFLVAAITMLVTLFSAGILGMMITRSITHPLGQLVEGSAALASGDFSHRVAITGNDEITRLASVFNGMTEKLEALYEELSLVVNSIPGLAWSSKPDGAAEFFNQHYLAFVGRSPEELLGFGWKVVVHPDDIDNLTAAWRTILATRRTGETEARLRRFDGEYRWFLIRATPMLDQSGRILKWFGINMDIEDRKRAEEKLRRSEAFLAEGQKLARIGSFYWRLEKNEIVWSEELYRIFELDTSQKITLELIGSRVYPDDLPLLEDMVARAHRSESDLEYTHRLLLPDGSIKYLQFIAHGEKGVGGQMEYIGAVQDVTQNRLDEEALAKARSELAQVTKVTSLGLLTASIAHEVNQPLSGIVTNASTCLRMLSVDPPNVEGARETARRTIRDGNRASDVITRLRLLFGKKQSPTEVVDLNEAVREVIALSLVDLQRARVVVHSEFLENLPPVLGDRIQLQQAILNLVRNASEAMTTVDNRPREMSITTECEGTDLVKLSVRDSGIGLPSEGADKLFEAFYTTKGEGMGIGLSVSRSIIENHRGRLWAAANEGAPGATFSISIPRLGAPETDI